MDSPSLTQAYYSSSVSVIKLSGGRGRGAGVWGGGVGDKLNTFVSFLFFFWFNLCYFNNFYCRCSDNG